MSPRDTHKEPVITDVGTLQQLLTEKCTTCRRSPWFDKSLWAFLLANMGLLLTVGWALVTDHFAIKNISEDAVIHHGAIDRLDNRMVSTENKILIHDYKIQNLEKSKPN